MAPVAAGKTALLSVNEITEGNKTLEASPASLSKIIVAHNADVFFADRPGKPDDHHSNGDDMPVRPPR
mgnify:FL=1